MNEKIIFYISPYSGNYIRKMAIPFPVSGKMIVLQEFLSSDVREDVKIVEELEECEKDIDCTNFNLNVTALDKKNNHTVSLSYTPLPDIEDLVIPFQDLINITRSWIELYKQKIPYIILERNNDIYSIKGAQTLE